MRPFKKKELLSRAENLIKDKDYWIDSLDSADSIGKSGLFEVFNLLTDFLREDIENGKLKS